MSWSFENLETGKTASDGGGKEKYYRAQNEKKEYHYQPLSVYPCHAQATVLYTLPILHSGTAEGIQWSKVISRVGLSADPAKLKVAIVASHVVAALGLLDARLADLAEANVFILGPLFELLVNHSVAGGE